MRHCSFLALVALTALGVSGGCTPADSNYYGANTTGNTTGGGANSTQALGNTTYAQLLPSKSNTTLSEGAATLASVSADQSDPALIDRSTTASGVQPAGNDTLSLYYRADPNTLNVLTANDNISGEFHAYVYEGLATPSFANPDKFLPVLAESWEFDKENLEYTIHLRKGVKWHPMRLPDGEELPQREFTSKDVKFTFDCILNQHVQATSLRSYFVNPEATTAAGRIKIKVTVIDRYTVKVRWKEPYFLAREFTLGVPILPRHVYSVDQDGEPISFDFSSKEFADGFNFHWANTRMCGTGPLIFEKWDKEQKLTMRRNPEYWGKPFYFSRIVFWHQSNPNTALKQILQNEYDWGLIREKDKFIQSASHPNVASGKVILDKYRYPGYRYLGFNFKRPLFQDLNVRRAIAHAIPVDQIIEKVYFNLADRLTGPFLPDSSANNNDLPRIEFDLKKAEQLLDEAGWSDTNSDGVRDKMIAGQRVEARFDLMTYADRPQFQTIAEIIKENCRKIGIDVIISPAKWALMIDKLHEKEFDAAMLGWAMGWKGDPFQIWHGSQADEPDSSNAIGYNNLEVNRLIEELRVTFDLEKQKSLYHEIHRLIYEDQPYVFLFMDKRTAGRSGRLLDVEYYPIRPCYDSSEWHSNRVR